MHIDHSATRMQRKSPKLHAEPLKRTRKDVDVEAMLQGLPQFVGEFHSPLLQAEHEET